MAQWNLYEGLKKAVGEIDEAGVSAFGLSSAYLYGLANVDPDSVPAEFVEEFYEILAKYAGADPSLQMEKGAGTWSEFMLGGPRLGKLARYVERIDDSLAANSMLMLDDRELEKLAGRIRALYERVGRE
jgi:hypothetical protein